MVLSSRVYSWIIVVPLVPSVLVTIFVLYHLLINRTLRTAINNHVIILLLLTGLFSQLTSGIWHVYFFRTDTVISETSEFCFAWVFCISLSSGWPNALMAWASIERHILIFYPNWLSTKIKRLFVHYIPLSVCILWPFIFYTVAFFILPCDLPPIYSRRSCNLYDCILRFPSLALTDSIGNYILPSFLIIIFSLALVIRVLFSRYRVRRRIDWRNYKKLASQLLSISVLYAILQFPAMILYAAYSAGLSRTIAADYYGDSIIFNYWIIQFTPFVTVLSLPDLKIKCRNLFLFCRRTPIITPAMIVVTHTKRGPVPVIQ